MKITVTELEQNPQLLATALDDLGNWWQVNWYLKDARNVSLEYIEKHYDNAKKLGTVNSCDPYLGFLRKALKVKITPIQKTMSPYQLLQTGTRLWAQAFSPYEIGDINHLTTKLKQKVVI